MSIVHKRFTLLYGSLFTVFVLYGASLTLVGAILPRVFIDFKWSYIEAGFVLAGWSIGAFIGAFVAGRLLHILGIRLAMLTGLGLDVAGLLLFGSSTSILPNLLLYVGIGIGQGFLEVSINWAVVRMSQPGDGRAMNLVHGAFSIGAVLGPIVVGAILASGMPWTYAFKGVALLFSLLFLASLFLPFGILGKDAATETRHFQGLTRSPAYWLGFLVLFLYVGAELGISNWSSEFFVKAMGSSVETGALVVSLFWTGLLAGRLGFPLLLPKARTDRLIVVLGLIFAVAAGLILAAGIAGPRAVVLGFAAVALAGLGASCIYPSAMTLVGSAFPETQGPALSFAATGGTLGAFVFPFAMSGIAGTLGLAAGFASYAGIAALSAAASFALAAAVRARARPSA
jgi:fucose permease